MKVEKRIDGKKLTIVLINFNNSLGSGMIEPAEFGFMDNRNFI
jgi:phospholipase/lecithinase/hemolysin